MNGSKRICLITGSYKGMGFETARQLADRGMHVIVSARSLEKSAPAAKEICQSGGSAEAIQLDVTDDSSVADALADVQNQHGKIDVLINNAGVNPEFAVGATPETLTKDLLRQIFETNFFGAFAMIRSTIPLLASGADARIVNVSSTLGSLAAMSDPNCPFYSVNTAAYNASKAALNSLTVSYSKALSELGIAVISVCPGWVKTDIGSDAAMKTVEEGVRITVDLASREKVTTGVFVDDAGTVPW